MTALLGILAVLALAAYIQHLRDQAVEREHRRTVRRTERLIRRLEDYSA